jgi:dihydrolipoamide dehydrogenase
MNVDVAVIGAGTAGMSAYRAAVAQGKRTVLIERGTYGTTCARVGCMPSKLLIAAAEAAHHARHAGPFGVHAEVKIDGQEVMRRVRSERDRFVGFVLEDIDGFEHKLVGNARFLAPNRLDVDGTVVEARAIVIATGSSPFVPSIFAGAGDRLVVNDDVFDWTDLPASVAVFGVGVIGLELGQALHRLGVRMRIFGRGGALAHLGDPVVRAAAEEAFQEELRIDLDAKVKHLKRVADGVEIEMQDGTKETFEYVLVATGRRPNLASLNLEAAHLELDSSGVPLFERTTLQCGSSSVFIAGDANEDQPLLHEAADEGRIAGENAARFPDVRPGHRRSPLAIVFSEPQLASVGARFQDLPDGTTIGAVSFVNQGRSRVMLQNKGALRVYFGRDRTFLGAQMAGPRVEHIAHLLAWAHQQRLTLDQMLAMPFYHPVIEEGLRTALRDAAKKVQERS